MGPWDMPLQLQLLAPPPPQNAHPHKHSPARSFKLELQGQRSAAQAHAPAEMPGGCGEAASCLVDTISFAPSGIPWGAHLSPVSGNGKHLKQGLHLLATR